jgi:antitoxin component YwqK of YwqJK toxin-antitoxin module
MTYEYKVTHRDDGTLMWEEFFKEGQLHREGDRPAWVSYRADGSVEWEQFWKKGQRHREGDRPAVVWYRADGSVASEEFWKEDQQYTPSKAKPCEGKTVEIDGVKYVLTPAD